MPNWLVGCVLTEMQCQGSCREAHWRQGYREALDGVYRFSGLHVQSMIHAGFMCIFPYLGGHGTALGAMDELLMQGCYVLEDSLTIEQYDV
jgi:hypothetical protein